MKKVFNFVINLMYPNRCICCNMIEVNEKVICDKCSEAIIFTKNDDKKLKYVKKTFSPFIYDTSIRDGIFNLKFVNMPQNAPSWSCLMYDHIRNEMPKLNIDTISFIPMHKKKYKKRGYNQSKLLAINLSKLCKIPTVQTLYKSKNHTQLHKLGLEERTSNIADTFEIIKKNSSHIDGKNILLIDDVLTTGSTLNECAKVLKSFGGVNIYAVTVATVN